MGGRPGAPRALAVPTGPLGSAGPPQTSLTIFSCILERLTENRMFGIAKISLSLSKTREVFTADVAEYITAEVAEYSVNAREQPLLSRVRGARGKRIQRA